MDKFSTKLNKYIPLIIIDYSQLVTKSIANDYKIVADGDVSGTLNKKIIIWIDLMSSVLEVEKTKRKVRCGALDIERKAARANRARQYLA